MSRGSIPMLAPDQTEPFNMCSERDQNSDNCSTYTNIWEIEVFTWTGKKSIKNLYVNSALKNNHNKFNEV